MQEHRDRSRSNRNPDEGYAGIEKRNEIGYSNVEEIDRKFGNGKLHRQYG